MGKQPSAKRCIQQNLGPEQMCVGPYNQPHNTKQPPTSSHQPPTTRHSPQNASQQSPVISQQKQKSQYQPAAMSNQPASKRCIPQNLDPRHATLCTKHYQTLMMWKAYGPKATRANGMREATNTSTLGDGGTREAKLETKQNNTLHAQAHTHEFELRSAQNPKTRLTYYRETEAQNGHGGATALAQPEQSQTRII